MSLKIYIEWNDRYNTGHKLIDEQHRTLVNIINELYTAAIDESINKTEVFKMTIKNAVNYTAYHFSQEEKIMEAVQYSKIEEHKKIHKYFLTQILEHVRLYEEGTPLTINKFIRFLKDWLLEHIAVTDVAMVREIAKMLKNKTDDNTGSIDNN